MDGRTERQNQTVEHYLRCYCSYRQNDRVSKLLLAEFTYNNSHHSTIGTTPFRALYGYDLDIRINPGRLPPVEVPEAKLRIERMKDLGSDGEKQSPHKKSSTTGTTAP